MVNNKAWKWVPEKEDLEKEDFPSDVCWKMIKDPGSWAFVHVGGKTVFTTQSEEAEKMPKPSLERLIKELEEMTKELKGQLFEKEMVEGPPKPKSLRLNDKWGPGLLSVVIEYDKPCKIETDSFPHRDKPSKEIHTTSLGVFDDNEVYKFYLSLHEHFSKLWEKSNGKSN